MRAGPSIIACGDDALRILCGEGDIRHSLAQKLAEDPLWLEIVPGKRDVTVAFDPHAEQMSQAWARLEAALVPDIGHDPAAAATHVFTASFGGADGPDLAALAARLGLNENDIIARVEASALIVDMLGFTPGFAYLGGLDGALVSERLANPRTRVAAGSIGLITGQIGLYALDGPGGWPIIGRVLGPLFDRASPDPFVLRPGDRVVLQRAPSA
ncbi:MAG: carboxyltransferase domain-containing protein [Hyphomonas sp.]|nr:carboxyltransferase domain-containing protein [Hyphomonas sp.]